MTCWKIRYGTKREAARAARGVAGRHGSSRKQIDSFRCDQCGGWHIGHRPRVNKRIQAVRRREQ